MASLLLALLLAAPDFADPEIRLPAVPGGSKPATTHPTLHINLTGDGHVRANKAQLAFGDPFYLKHLTEAGDVGLRSMTLDELGGFLDTAKRVYALHQKAVGKPGYETGRVLDGTYTYTPLFVTIRADRDAPWEHVEWLMTICAEVNYYKTQLAVLRGGKHPAVLPAFLPKEAPFKPIDEAPAHKLTALVTFRQVLRTPNTTTTRLGYAHRHQDWDTAWSAPTGREGLLSWLRQAKAISDASPVALVGEIAASHQVPVWRVASVLSAFREVGYQHVHIWGSRIPPVQPRKLTRLPYPVRNKLPSAVHGTGGLGYRPLAPLKDFLGLEDD